MLIYLYWEVPEFFFFELLLIMVKHTRNDESTAKNDTVGFKSLIPNDCLEGIAFHTLQYNRLFCLHQNPVEGH